MNVQVAIALLSGLVYMDGSLHSSVLECDRATLVALITEDGEVPDAGVAVSDVPMAQPVDAGTSVPAALEVKQGVLFVPPADGCYLNVPTCEQAANDRLAVQNAYWLDHVLPATISAVIGAVVTGIVSYQVARANAAWKR